MTVERSQLEPQSPYWHEDLPGRTTDSDGLSRKALPDIGDDLLRLDDKCLELSRASSMQRGPGLLFGCVMLIGMLSIADSIVMLLRKGFAEVPAGTALLACGLLVFLTAIIYVIKKDVRTPRDLPIRFYRDTGTIVSLEYATKLNPFARWKVVQKKLDWNNVEAEVAKIAGYNGKTFSVRYSLLIAQCAPGTKKVTERIVLKADEIFPIALHNMWDFIRLYMTKGVMGLRATPRANDIMLKRCLLRYYPVLDFTPEGRERRKHMNIVAWIFNIVVFIPLFWLFLPIGLLEFVALKFAPEPQWRDGK